MVENPIPKPTFSNLATSELLIKAQYPVPVIGDDRGNGVWQQRNLGYPRLGGLPGRLAKEITGWNLYVGELGEGGKEFLVNLGLVK